MSAYEVFSTEVPISKLIELCRAYKVQFSVSVTDTGSNVLHFGDEVEWYIDYRPINVDDYTIIAQRLATKYPDISWGR